MSSWNWLRCFSTLPVSAVQKWFTCKLRNVTPDNFSMSNLAYVLPSFSLHTHTSSMPCHPSDSLPSVCLYLMPCSHKFYPSFSPHLLHLSDPSVSQEVTKTPLHVSCLALWFPFFFHFPLCFSVPCIVSLAVPLKWCFSVFLHLWSCLSVVCITCTHISHQNIVTQSL